MESEELRALQAPLKERYRDDPGAAVVTLSATGTLDDGTLTILFNCAVALPFVFIVPWRYVASTFLGNRESFRAPTIAQGRAGS